MIDYVPEDSPQYEKARLLAQQKQGGIRDYIPEGEVAELQDVPHSCPECGWRGHDEIGVQNHLNRQHPGAAARTREQLAAEAANEPRDRKKGQHKSTLGGPESLAENPRYVCPICSHRAKDRVDLINHLEFAHKEEEERLAEEGKAAGEKGLDIRTESDPDPRVMLAAARQGALPGQDGEPHTSTEAAEFLTDLKAGEATDDSDAKQEDGPKIEGDPIPQDQAEMPLDGQNAAAGVTHPADEAARTGDESDSQGNNVAENAEKEEADSEQAADREISASDVGTSDDTAPTGKRQKVVK
jgi:hypothetical protein